MKRRTFVTATAGGGMALLAGCSGDTFGLGGDDTGSGVFRLLISDQPTGIEEFDSLDVTLSSARVFLTGDDEELTPAVVNATATGTVEDGAVEGNATATETVEDGDVEGEGFVEFDLDSVTVDLTQVIGERAVPVLEGELEEGRYSGIELRVATVEGVVDGDTVNVMVPSDRLRIVRPFEVEAGEEVSFVFDITVIQKGQTGEYNLLPVIGKSGVEGEDVDVEEVETEDDE